MESESNLTDAAEEGVINTHVKRQNDMLVPTWFQTPQYAGQRVDCSVWVKHTNFVKNQWTLSF
jgi:hypothetical protein